jgi:hypothetical protein
MPFVRTDYLFGNSLARGRYDASCLNDKLPLAFFECDIGSPIPVAIFNHYCTPQLALKLLNLPDECSRQP